MVESMVLPVGIVVFSMMVLGLGLTIWEFSRGQPRREAIAAAEAERADIGGPQQLQGDRNAA